MVLDRKYSVVPYTHSLSEAFFGSVDLTFLTIIVDVVLRFGHQLCQKRRSLVMGAH